MPTNPTSRRSESANRSATPTTKTKLTTNRLPTTSKPTAKLTTYAQTTSISTDSCELKNDCKECVGNDQSSQKCFWCPTTQKCQSYGLLPDSCGLQWYLGQCNFKGYWVVIVAPCVGLLIIGFLLCCCYCCCCRNNKNNVVGDENERLLMNTRRKSEKERRQEYFEGRQKDQYATNPSLRTYGLFNKNERF